jgi:hypothetical protein
VLEDELCQEARHRLPRLLGERDPQKRIGAGRCHDEEVELAGSTLKARVIAASPHRHLLRSSSRSFPWLRLEREHAPIAAR